MNTRRFFLFLLAGMAGLPLASVAQSVHISNSGMHVPAGAHVNIGGSLILANAASIQNSGQIRLGGDWTNNAAGLTGNNPGTVIFSGNALQNIYGSASTVFHHLTITNASGVNLNTPTASVTGTLNLQTGIFSTGSGSNTVVIGSGGNVIRTSGWVNGNLQKPIGVGNPVVAFEVGGTLYYSPVTLAFSSVTTPGTYTARVVPGLHPQIGLTCLNSTRYVNQYWRLTRNLVSPANYTMSFGYSSPLFVGNPQPSLFAVGRFSSGAWTFPAVTGTPTASSLNASGGTGDGEFAIAEGCVLLPNDPRSGAIALGTTALGNCSSTSGVITTATVSPESNSTATTGEDLWYRFIASEPGIRIQVASTSFNALIELQDGAGTTLATENALAGTGTEILNFGGPLVIGQTYYIAVRNFNSGTGQGNFTICLQRLADTGCFSGPGPYGSCSLFKAINTNATSYSFSFTNTATQQVTILNANFSGLVIISSLLPGSSYQVAISCTYNLTDGAGNPETITINTPNACTISMSPHPDLDLRTFDQCPPTGTVKSPTATVAANQWLCGATYFQWEFTPVNPAGPLFTANGANGTRFLPLPGVQAIAPGTTYNVRIRPWFVNGTFGGNWGPDFQCMRVGTSGGIIPDDSPSPAQLGLTGLPDVVLYPNPNAGDRITLRFSAVPEKPVQASVRDAMGRLVLSGQMNVAGTTHEFIPARSLAPGMYTLELDLDGRQVSKKWLVQP